MNTTSNKKGGSPRDIAVDINFVGNRNHLKAYAERFKKIKSTKSKGGNN